jgi:hypothetical protein
MMIRRPLYGMDCTTECVKVTHEATWEGAYLRLELAASGSAFPFLHAMILSLSHVMISPLDRRARQDERFAERRPESAGPPPLTAERP